jgi:hypothetical protein
MRWRARLEASLTAYESNLQLSDHRCSLPDRTQGTAPGRQTQGQQKDHSPRLFDFPASIRLHESFLSTPRLTLNQKVAEFSTIALLDQVRREPLCKALLL